jgi:hypothetical protein
MNIGFERSIRTSLCPVRRDPWGNNFKCISINGSKPKVNIDHLMIINIINDKLINHFWSEYNNGKVPKTWKTELVYKTLVDKFKMHFSKGTSNKSFNYFLKQPELLSDFSLSYKQIIKDYPFIHDRIKTPSALIKVIEEVDNLRFNLNMKIRAIGYETKAYYDYQTKKNGHTHHPIIEEFFFNTFSKEACSLMRFNISDKVKYSRGGICDFKIRVSLNGPLIQIMFQGIRTVTIDWMPEEIYTSKINTYARMLYILMLGGMTKKRKYREFEYSVDEIIERLQLNQNLNRKRLINIVESYLNDLEQEKFIKVNIRGSNINRRYKIDQLYIK